MTDIAIYTKDFQTENRSWHLSSHGSEMNPSITLDVSAFTAATHYPKGYIKSGIALAKLAGNRKYVPYVNGGSGGAGVFLGLLYASTAVPDLLDLTKDVGASLVIHGAVNPAKLPIANGATGGGFVDAAAIAANTHKIYFEEN